MQGGPASCSQVSRSHSHASDRRFDFFGRELNPPGSTWRKEMRRCASTPLVPAGRRARGVRLGLSHGAASFHAHESACGAACPPVRAAPSGVSVWSAVRVSVSSICRCTHQRRRVEDRAVPSTFDANQVRACGGCGNRSPPAHPPPEQQRTPIAQHTATRPSWRRAEKRGPCPGPPRRPSRHVGDVPHHQEHSSSATKWVPKRHPIGTRGRGPAQG